MMSVPPPGPWETARYAHPLSPRLPANTDTIRRTRAWRGKTGVPRTAPPPQRSHNVRVQRHPTAPPPPVYTQRQAGDTHEPHPTPPPRHSTQPTWIHPPSDRGRPGTAPARPSTARRSPDAASLHSDAARPSSETARPSSDAARPTPQAAIQHPPKLTPPTNPQFAIANPVPFTTLHHLFPHKITHITA